MDVIQLLELYLKNREQAEVSLNNWYREARKLFLQCKEDETWVAKCDGHYLGKLFKEREAVYDICEHFLRNPCSL